MPKTSAPSPLVYSSPLTVRFRGLDSRDGLLLRGDAGWGEFSPFEDYTDAQSAPWLAAALEAAHQGWPSPVRSQVPVNVTVPAVGPDRARQIVLAGAGCTTAKVKVGQVLAQSISQQAPGSGRTGAGSQADVGTGGSVVRSAGAGSGAGADADTGRESRPSTQTTLPDGADVTGRHPLESIDVEVARIAAVRSALDEAYGPGVGRIRVDANGAWTVPQALEHLRAIDKVAGGLEYAEQPCASVEELAQLRRLLAVAGLAIPIAADESIRRAEDPLRVQALDAADIAVLKVQPLGGVRACLDLAERIAMPVVVSSALESSIGLAAGLALAGSLPQLPYACGLATSQLFVHDVVAQPLLPRGGTMPVLAADNPRLNPMPVHENRARASAQMTDRWLRRLGRVSHLL